MTKNSNLKKEQSSWKLTPLTPEYQKLEHGCYVQAISNALEDQKIRNIALSGNYGVGKSSILQKVAEDFPDRVIELSLSTLAPIEEPDLDGSVPKQATTSTNRIQQEIVKQLLYREEPNKTPESRFQRIDRFHWPRELIATLFLGLVTTVIFLLTGWTESIEKKLVSDEALGAWAHLIFLVVSSGSFFVMRRLSFGRIHVNQLSTGTATVTLDKKSVSFFDQYLDEIVYFFEVSERDIVIFEDLDRFDEPLIFETLRALNTLLNSAPQIKKTVRFVYAIKDSIFDQTDLLKKGRLVSKRHSEIKDPAQSEVVRANRTKFFDLVIPVVPFITHRSAKSLTKRLLDEIEHDIEPELLDLISRHIPDMRLLKNARNEFLVFRDRIFSGDGEHLDLNDTELFAMMLYKSTHLTDFEEIYIGRSNLDQIYSLSRKLVAENIQIFEKKLRKNQFLSHELNGIKAKSSEITQKLFSHIERTVRACGFNTGTNTFTFDGKTFQNSEIDEDFWIEFSQAGDSSTLTWRNNYRQSLTFQKTDLEKALNLSLSSKHWDTVYLNELQNEKDNYLDNVKFLRTSDMGELITNSEFLIEYSGSEQSLDSIAKKLLNEGLAYHLLREGYINRNFTLYTSTFHGDRVSTVATNFVIHHVEKNAMDEYFHLEADDVDAVIRECGKKALSEPALYNISILDHLLKNDVDLADILIKALIKLRTDEKQFLQAYLSSGTEVKKFVERFVKSSSKVLLYLVGDVELDESSRLALIDHALINLSGELRYMTAPRLCKYIKANYSVLEALTKTPCKHENAERIAELFSNADVVLPDLSPLSKNVREALVAKNLYEISRENLQLALDNDAELALDEIESEDKRVYNYVFNNLASYLSEVIGFSVTVKKGERFVEVIQRCHELAPDNLQVLIQNASSECVVCDLEELPQELWSLLVSEQRVKASFFNVESYIALIGELDDNMANLLSAEGNISGSKNVDESNKESLALNILNASMRIPSADLRVKLVVSLELESYLDIDDISAEDGDFFSVLLASNIIEDEAETYTHLKQMGWAAREHFIEKSSKFGEYLSPELLQGDLAVFLRSNKVSQELKLSVVEQADEYLWEADKADKTELAEFAAQNGCQLSIESLSKVANDNVSAQTILKLLMPHLPDISREDLFDVLKPLGGPYARLTIIGRDRPKVPNTSDNIELMETLKTFGIVSTCEPEGRYLRVNKKHK